MHNVALGAQCERVALDRDLAELAERAVDAIGMDYAGVDILRDSEGSALVDRSQRHPGVAWPAVSHGFRYRGAARPGLREPTPVADRAGEPVESLSANVRESDHIRDGSQSGPS